MLEQNASRCKNSPVQAVEQSNTSHEAISTTEDDEFDDISSFEKVSFNFGGDSYPQEYDFEDKIIPQCDTQNPVANSHSPRIERVVPAQVSQREGSALAATFQKSRDTDMDESQLEVLNDDTQTILHPSQIYPKALSDISQDMLCLLLCD